MPSVFTRRQFFGLGAAGLIGLTRKSGMPLAGGFVHEAQVRGHRLRDGVAYHAPRQHARASVVIIGGGIAGLSAAWRLQKRGVTDVVVLEMEPEAGGNARAGHNEITGFPWAAHYVPVPGVRSTLVRELFEELGVLEAGQFDERSLCQAPQERLFLHGRWQEGLEPRTGPMLRDRDQIARFGDRIAACRAGGEFTVPMALGARPSKLDGLSMAAWLDAEGLDSPWLRWQVNYACRDDYGALAADTSAWAGIHYFAAREADERGPVTWPEGNGWITARLMERVGRFVRPNQMVTRVTRQARVWEVAAEDTLWRADAVIFAAPSFLASRIIGDGVAVPDFVYSPWLTANLTLERWPAERGAPVAWDNVLFDSPALGYVVATHQSLRTYIPRTVWTYYWALAAGTPRENRRWLLTQDWQTLATRILDDLSRAHPDIRECVSRVDICRMGHAMIRPTPGFLSSPSRRLLQTARDGLFFAHSDVSGLSLFEEAQYRGVMAADAPMRAAG
jgi:glycine/D-amino acid oxidase-like deaminating enzyme